MTFDEWIEQQEDGVAACDHLTFGRRVWEAAQRFEREACAKVCEQRIGTGSMYASSRDFFNTKKIINECEHAILARGNK
jgi:hypothetical protein